MQRTSKGLIPTSSEARNGWRMWPRMQASGRKSSWDGRANNGASSTASCFLNAKRCCTSCSHATKKRNSIALSADIYTQSHAITGTSSSGKASGRNRGCAVCFSLQGARKLDSSIRSSSDVCSRMRRIHRTWRSLPAMRRPEPQRLSPRSCMSRINIHSRSGGWGRSRHLRAQSRAPFATSY